jgi:hypothetical protein
MIPVRVITSTYVPSSHGQIAPPSETDAGKAALRRQKLNRTAERAESDQLCVGGWWVQRQSPDGNPFEHGGRFVEFTKGESARRFDCFKIAQNG